MGSVSLLPDRGALAKLLSCKSLKRIEKLVQLGLLHRAACCKVQVYFPTREPQVQHTASHKKYWLYGATCINMRICMDVQPWTQSASRVVHMRVFTQVLLYTCVQPLISMGSCTQHLWLLGGKICIHFTACHHGHEPLHTCHFPGRFNPFLNPKTISCSKVTYY